MGKRSRSQMEQRLTRAASAHPSVSHLYKDIRRFETDQKIPADFSHYAFFSDQDDQVLWYKEMLEAWPKSDAPQKVTPQEAAKRVLAALEKVDPYGVNIIDLQGILFYYELYDYRVWPSTRAVAQDDTMKLFSYTPERTRPAPMVEDGPAFLLNTLPVSKDNVTDGCCFTVFVEVKELHLLPPQMLFMISENRKAVVKGVKCSQDELLKPLNTEDYEVVNVDNVKCLSKKYQIMLRGINASQIGTETRDKLVKIVAGKSLTVAVYYFDDSSMHWIGDVYCDGIRLQDQLLISETFDD